MASSAQFIPYVDDGYHPDGYVGGEHRLAVELTVPDASDVSGVAERKIVASVSLQAQDAGVSGSGVRTSNALEADLHDGPSIASVTAGNAERQIVHEVSAVEVDSPSEVSGVAERIITSSGSLQAQSSTIAEGISEREIVDVDASPQAQSSDVENNVKLTTTLTAKPTDNNVVAGVAERIITASGTLSAQESDVVGEGLYKINIGGALKPTDNNLVVGAAERVIVDVDASPQAQSSTIDASTNYGFNVDAISIESQASTIAEGIAERKVEDNGATHAFKPTDNNVVAGVAEREITGSAALQPTVTHRIDGFAERIINASGSPQAQASTASGVSERTVTASGSPQAQAVTVSGTSERVITSSGSLQAQDVTVAGVSERIINTLSADLHDGPSAIVDVAGDGERSIVTTVTALVVDDSSNVTVTANIGRDTSADLKPTDNNVVAGVAERTINASGTPQAQASSVVGTGSAGKVASGNPQAGGGGVGGGAERVIVEVQANVQTQGDARLEMESTRSLKPISESLTAAEVGVSAVTGDAERSIVTSDGTLSAQASAVSGSAERDIDDQGGNAIQAQASEVSGSAERVIVVVDATPQAQNAVTTNTASRTLKPISESLTASEVGVSGVSGVGEREITGSGTLAAQASAIVGASEREMPGSGTLQPTANNEVAGVAERTINASGTLGNGLVPEAVTHNVTNNGSGEYVIDGVGGNPTLEFHRGSTYTINVNAGGHPFWIKTEKSTGSYYAYNDGVTNNGTDNGTITFVVPDDAPDNLYYVCEYHASMQGDINVSAALTGALHSATVVGVAERELDDDTGNAVVAQDVSVIGVAERTIVVVDGDLTASEVGVSAVVGVGEREVDDNEGNSVQAQASTVDGVAERIIEAQFDPDGDAHAVIRAEDVDVTATVNRTVFVTSAVIESQDAQTSGRATRTEATANVPIVKAFRIKTNKMPNATIRIKQPKKLTDNSYVITIRKPLGAEEAS